MTKQQLVDFANRFFTNGYATVYKTQGVDSTQKKIDKPAITPIQANRDQKSDFVKAIQESEVEPIQPVFVDFSKDLAITKTKNKLPLYYKKNVNDGLFTLVFRYDFGHEDDNRYDIARDYLDYVGTDKMSAMQIKQQFYKLACNYSINVNGDNMNITLSGLSENMPAALKLMEEVLHNAKADKESYAQYIDLTMKYRDDRKKNQRTCFDYLYYYCVYGPHNMRRDDMTEKQLREADPQELLNLLGNLSNIEHKVLYYGPMTEKELSALLAKEHKTPKALKSVAQGEPFVEQEAIKNEVVIAPFDAKNIYLRMYHNEGRSWNPDEAAIQEVFNEYYGGGMNGIVFQEMREARGLAYNAWASYYSPSRKDRKEYYLTHIITQNDKMVDAVTHFQEILNEMPASETAFQIAKDACTKRLASARTTKIGVLNAYISAQKLGLNISTNELIYKNLDKVQLKDIVDFEKQNMANKAYRYIILGDEKELDMKYLEKLGPVRRLSLVDIFGY